MDTSKEYGPHKYADQDGTSDCEFRCGCWAGPTRSGSKLLGVSAFGECPNNPLDGTRLGGTQDHEVVVERRFRKLEKELYEAKEKLRQIDPATLKLTEKAQAAERDLSDLRMKLVNSVVPGFPMDILESGLEIKKRNEGFKEALRKAQ